MRKASCVILVTLTLLQSQSAPADVPIRLPEAQGRQDREIIRGVTRLLDSWHMTRHPLDDEISQRAFEKFLEALDPMKVYFTKADVDGFLKFQTELDDLARTQDMGFAYQAFRILLQRIDERVAVIEELLAVEHDFTVDESIIIDPDKISYAATAAEGRERWRKRIKYDLLMELSNDFTIEEARDKLSRRYQNFRKRMRNTDGEGLLEVYLGALTSAYDPHTVYMSAKTVDNFEISMRLQLEGIGAALRTVDGYTTVSYLVPGGAAERDGRLKPEDRIVSVGEGLTGELVDVVDWNLSDVVPKIRGKKGTVVRVEVLPADKGAKAVIDIVREKVELTQSQAFGEVFELEGPSADRPYKVGVVDVPSFYRDMQAESAGATEFRSTTEDVRRILLKFREQHVDGVIVDLRRNGGGSLTEAIELTGLFIDQGPVVQVKDARGAVQDFRDPEVGVAWGGPLVLLTSKLSGSASEILAGAIQDYQRGLIVGDPTTHGKGTVQTLLGVGAHLRSGEGLGSLKITTQQFYRPTGDSTQNRGVMADLVLPSFTQHMDVSESDLDYSLPFGRVDPVPFPAVGQVRDKLVKELNRASRERVAANEKFTELEERISLYRKRKEQSEFTLDKERFQAEIAALRGAEEEAGDDEEDGPAAKPEVAAKKAAGEGSESEAGASEGKPAATSSAPEQKIDRNYYLEEVMTVTVDYMRLLSAPELVVH